MPVAKGRLRTHVRQIEMLTKGRPDCPRGTPPSPCARGLAPWSISITGVIFVSITPTRAPAAQIQKEGGDGPERDVRGAPTSDAAASDAPAPRRPPPQPCSKINEALNYNGC